MFVRPSACNNTVSTGRIFIKSVILSILRKSVEKPPVPLKSDMNNEYFTRRNFHVYDNTSLNYSQNDKYYR
jgi:hypothetical protein